MRILVAMLGGTISSVNDSGTVRLGSPSFVQDFLPENCSSHEFVFPEFITYSSEDATPDIYRESLRRIVNEVNASAYDGILITHGTDTCAFFAQLAARVLSTLDIPFVITGSMRSPDVDPEEASGNLGFAVKMLEEGKTGVVFRNRNGKEQLYKAHLIMSPDIDGIFSEYSDGIMLKPEDHSGFLSCFKLPRMLVIPAFPITSVPQGDYDRVLICCNHSGTAASSLEMLIRFWTSTGVKCYLAPVPTKGAVYESRKRLTDAGAIELPGMPVEGAWA